MNNLIRSTTEFALYIVQAYIGHNETSPLTIVDATCGNGHDTLALAKMIWPEGRRDKFSSGGKLYAFDIQQDAIQSTSVLLRSEGFAKALEGGAIRLIRDSHDQMDTYLESEDGINIAVFNLGYLPGGNKALTTREGSTLCAVKKSLKLLKTNGLICITMYSGHPAGAQEKTRLLQFAEGLDSKQYHVSYISMPNQKNHPPEILLITRKK